MSAWMLDNVHIDYLISFTLDSDHAAGGSLQWYDVEPKGEITTQWHLDHVRKLTHDTADQVGLVLTNENQRSVNYRYNESEPFPLYRWTPFPTSFVPWRSVQTYMKAIRCYDYQACEHSGWRTSEAYRITEAMMARALVLQTDADWPEGWPITEIDRVTASLGREGELAWLAARREQ